MRSGHFNCPCWLTALSEILNPIEEEKEMKTWIYEKDEEKLKQKIKEFGLSEAQEKMLTDIAERIWFCEEGIPQSLWCDDCKTRMKRVWELFARFRKLVHCQDVLAGYEPGQDKGNSII